MLPIAESVVELLNKAECQRLMVRGGRKSRGTARAIP
jgi:hypothetical protein